MFLIIEYEQMFRNSNDPWQLIVVRSNDWLINYFHFYNIILFNYIIADDENSWFLGKIDLW